MTDFERLGIYMFRICLQIQQQNYPAGPVEGCWGFLYSRIKKFQLCSFKISRVHSYFRLQFVFLFYVLCRYFVLFDVCVSVVTFVCYMLYHVA